MSLRLASVVAWFAAGIAAATPARSQPLLAPPDLASPPALAAPMFAAPPLPAEAPPIAPQVQPTPPEGELLPMPPQAAGEGESASTGLHQLIADESAWYSPRTWIGATPWDTSLELGLNGSSGTSEFASGK